MSERQVSEHKRFTCSLGIYELIKIQIKFIAITLTLHLSEHLYLEGSIYVMLTSGFCIHKLVKNS